MNGLRAVGLSHSPLIQGPVLSVCLSVSYCTLHITIYTSGRLNLKLSPGLTKHHVMKTCWGSRGIAPRITSALVGGEWLASRAGCFISGERATCIYRIGGWLGPTGDLDVVVKIKIPSHCRESNPRCSARCLVTILTELPRLHTD
jgi:hypothetical protein